MNASDEGPSQGTGHGGMPVKHGGPSESVDEGILCPREDHRDTNGYAAILHPISWGLGAHGTMEAICTKMHEVQPRVTERVFTSRIITGEYCLASHYEGSIWMPHIKPYGITVQIPPTRTQKSSQNVETRKGSRYVGNDARRAHAVVNPVHDHHSMTNPNVDIQGSLFVGAIRVGYPGVEKYANPAITTAGRIQLLHQFNSPRVIVQIPPQTRESSRNVETCEESHYGNDAPTRVNPVDEMDAPWVNALQLLRGGAPFSRHPAGPMSALLEDPSERWDILAQSEQSGVR